METRIERHASSVHGWSGGRFQPDAVTFHRRMHETSPDTHDVTDLWIEIDEDGPTEDAAEIIDDPATVGDDLRPEPVIDYADGRPAWVLDGDDVYACVPVEIIRRAAALGRDRAEVVAAEERDGYIDADAIHGIEDDACDLVARIADLFPTDDPEEGAR